MLAVLRWVGSWSGGLVAGVTIGVFLTVLAVIFTESWREKRACKAVLESFSADVSAMKVREAERLRTWDGYMDRLLLVSEPVKDERARPWLMPESLERAGFTVYEANADKLGLLPPRQIEQIARFYAKSERLAAEVRLLSSPAILFAGGNDKKWLREQNDETMGEWTQAADELLANLKGAKCNGQWPL